MFNQSDGVVLFLFVVGVFLHLKIVSEIFFYFYFFYDIQLHLGNQGM